MKKEDKNKNYSEEFLEDENLTFGQEETEEGDKLSDNVSEDEGDINEELDELEILQNKYDELNKCSYNQLRDMYDRINPLKIDEVKRKVGIK